MVSSLLFMQNKWRALEKVESGVKRLLNYPDISNDRLFKCSSHLEV
jgi:hypothetical protein